MGSKSSSGIKGYRYYMGLHMGLCRGPVDSLVEIRVGGRVAWKGEVAESEFNINNPGLFGGQEREGGIQGLFRFMPGYSVQVAPNYVKGAISGQQNGAAGTVTIPPGTRPDIAALIQAWATGATGGGGTITYSDFRGVASCYYSGLIACNNPYPKPWAFRVRRVEQGWDADVPWQRSLATVWLANGQIKAMNPVHVLYEALTNRAWARGVPRVALDEFSFAECARQTLSEGLGICIAWRRQESIDEFIQRIVDYMGASLFPDPRSGLLTLRLIRGDYDPTTIPVFSYDNGLLSVERAEIPDRTQATNEVVVEWFDPLLKQKREARAQNLGGIRQQGAIYSTKKSYLGAPTLEIAQRLAERDLRAESSALRPYRIKTDRRGWRAYGGAVFRIFDPERGINDIVRIARIRQSPVTKGEVEIEAVTDVFTMPNFTPMGSQDSAWVAPVTDATVPPVRVVKEASYRDLRRVLTTDQIAAVGQGQSVVITAVGKPSYLATSYRVAGAAGGETAYTLSPDLYPFCAVAKVLVAAGPYDTLISAVFETEPDVFPGMAAMVNGEEIIRLDGYNTATNRLQIARGCVDTVPAPIPVDARITFFDSRIGSDDRTYAIGETVLTRVLTRTASSELPLASAPTDTLTIAGRWNRPYAPGNVRVNGTRYLDADAVLTSEDIVFTWTHRDRLAQDDQVVEHAAGNIGPEAGVQYTVRILNVTSGASIRDVFNIEGTAWTYTLAMLAADGSPASIRVVLEAVNNGVSPPRVSWRRHDWVISRLASGAGYGRLYGASYGG